MNHHEQIVNRRGDDMAFLMFGHGKADDVIDWATQGKPFIAAVNAARVGFTAEQRENWDHNWMGFDFANAPMFSTTEGGLGGWIYQGNRSFPSFTYATKSGPEVPAATGTDFYNLRLDWSVPWNAFHTETVDTADRYEISLRSRDGVQTADVTPRHTQVWSTSPGTVVQWQNINNSTGAVIASGSVVADASGLVTIPQFSIGTDVGNRLILIKQVVAPDVNGPAAKTMNQQPTISWTAVSGAGSYDLWIRNVSTNQNPLVNVNVSGTSWTPTSSLGIGVYRVWVRTRTLSGQVSGWSQPYTFQINTPVTVNDLPSIYETARPVISWNALLAQSDTICGSINTSTGTSQVIDRRR